jgi:hypothetical protein
MSESSNGSNPHAQVELKGPQRRAQGRMGDVINQESAYPDTPAPTAMPPDTGRKRTHSKGR